MPILTPFVRRCEKLTTPAVAFLLLASPLGAQEVVEEGRFRLYKLQQPVGEERYEVRREGASRVTKATSELNFLGGGVPLTATLRTSADGTPERFEVKGRTSTLTRTDNEVVVSGRTARVRQHAAAREVAVPARFFTIGHYGPVAIEQMLFRYWAAHGRPAELPILPAGRVRFAVRGRDTVRVGGRAEVLDRYSVDGLVWGRRTTWFDAAGKLIAAVSGDAELDRMEAIRYGYQGAMPVFVAGAVRDGLADLARVAREVRPVREGAFALVGGRLIDGTGRAPVEDAVVVVRGGRIEAAGPASAVRVPAGVARVDVRGRTIIPGLWDTHGHYEQVEWPAVQLASGVTTVRDVGNEIELSTALRDAIQGGRALGPRMILAGVIDGGEHPLGVVTAATPEEARAGVRRYHAAGFRQIKIYEGLPPALVPVVTAEAHRLGMKVTGHVPAGMNALQFVEAGADAINHLNFVAAVLRPAPQGGRPSPLDLHSAEARRAIDFFRARGTFIEPTLARSEQHAHPTDTAYSRYEPGVAKAPLELQEALNTTGAPTEAGVRGLQSLRRLLEVAGHLHRAGIPLLLGSDLAVPGHSLHRELELAVEAGFTPMEAITAATRTAARVLGMEAESGTVEPGKRADLVILSADPLAAIRNIRSVESVVANGRMYRPADLWRASGFEP